MTMKFLSLVGLAIGIGFATAGRDRTFGDGELPEFLKPYDLNEDGTIDEEERQVARAARHAAHDAQDERRAERLAEIDTDGDGEVSDEEKESARDAMRAALEAKRAEKFAAIAGEDGCLDATEFAALPPLERRNADRVARLFDRLDGDDNDCISLEEFTARLRHHRKPSGHHPPRPGGEVPDGGGEGPGPRPGSDGPFRR